MACILIFLPDVACFLEKHLLRIGNRTMEIFELAYHSVEGPAKVHRRRPCFFKVLRSYLYFFSEILQICLFAVAGRHIKSESRSYTDRRGSSYSQLLYCYIHVLFRLEREIFLFTRKTRLVKNDQFVLVVKSYRCNVDQFFFLLSILYKCRTRSALFGTFIFLFLFLFLFFFRIFYLYRRHFMVLVCKEHINVQERCEYQHY